LCRRHNIICPKDNIISSEARTSLSQTRTNERCCNKLQMMCFATMWALPNEVALRANGIRPFAHFLTLKFFKILYMHFRAKLCFRIFHLCRRHNIICVAHATSFARKGNFIAACGTNERC